MDTKQADMITLLFLLLCNGLPVGNQALIRPWLPENLYTSLDSEEGIVLKVLVIRVALRRAHPTPRCYCGTASRSWGVCYSGISLSHFITPVGALRGVPMYINTLYLANILWLCFHFCFGVLPVCCCARCAQELLNYYASFCVWVETGLMVSACTLNPVRAAVQSSLYAEPQRYGKIGPQTFSLDFKCARAAQSIYSPSSMCFLQIVLLVRYPLSVIQAFGTSLTTLFWTWSEYLGQNAFRMFCPTYIRCSQKDDNRSPD